MTGVNEMFGYASGGHPTLKIKFVTVVKVPEV